jgi:hypothetical protein
MLFQSRSPSNECFSGSTVIALNKYVTIYSRNVAYIWCYLTVAWEYFIPVSVIRIKSSAGGFVQRTAWIFMSENDHWLQNLSLNCKMLGLSVWGIRIKGIKGISITQYFMWKFKISPGRFSELNTRFFIPLIIYSSHFFKCVFRDALCLSTNSNFWAGINQNRTKGED